MILDNTMKYFNFYNWNYAEIIILLSVITFCYVVRAIVSNFSIWWRLRRKLPPGPFRFPFWPILDSYPHKTLHDMRKIYGDIIGLYFGTNYTVVLNEYAIAKEVYMNPASLERESKIFRHIPQSGFLSANGLAWQEQRRFSMAVVRDLGLGKRNWEEVVMEEASIFIQYLSSLEGKPTDIEEPMQMSIISNVISFLIGRKINGKNDADTLKTARNVAVAALRFSGAAKLATLIPGLFKVFEILKFKGYDEAGKVLKKFSTFIQSEILAHKNDSYNNSRDFIAAYLEKLHQLKNSGDNKHTFSEEMLEGNCFTLFMASTDTILCTLLWILRFMAKHKDIQSKVYAEIVEVLGKDGKALYEERHKIPYTSAVIQEILRISSFVPLFPAARALEDIEVRGFVIPKGASILVNSWAVHHDPNYWEEPDQFKPERFLADNNTKLLKSLPSYYPFSIGRRMCPGEVIAWMEILTYFTEIVRNFEITTLRNTQLEIINGLLIFVAPQKLIFKKRNNIL